MKAKLLNYFSSRKLIILVTAAYTLIILVVILNRFWQYEALYYDHGMMEATAYQVSQFKMPLHDREYGRVSIYVDHLYPSLQLVLAPFYWINNSYETPLVAMALLVGSSVLIGYEIAIKYIKNRLMVYALLFAYTFYIGMQNAIIFMIHDITIQIPFLMLLFWSIIKDKKKLFYLLLLVNLGFKESVSVTTLSIGIFLLFYSRKWWRDIVITMLISVAYAYLSSKIIIPYFQLISFGKWGLFKYMPDISLNPLVMAERFVDTYTKRQTIWVSLSTFGFLPLFSPQAWILVIQDLAQRFVLIESNIPFRQGLNLHYSANLVVILFFSSVLAVSHLEKFKKYQKIITLHAVAIILITLLYHRFLFRGPLALVYNPDFYKITSSQGYMNDFIARIPKKGKLMVQNDLAVRFTHDNLYLLLNEEHFKKVNPDVVVFDYRDGQNISNYWPNSREGMMELAAFVLADPNYKVYYHDVDRYILVKK